MYINYSPTQFGTNINISNIFNEKFGKNWRFHEIVFQELRQFFRRKLSKIAKNSCHNIDPHSRNVDKPVTRRFFRGKIICEYVLPTCSKMYRNVCHWHIFKSLSMYLELPRVKWQRLYVKFYTYALSILFDLQSRVFGKTNFFLEAIQNVCTMKYLSTFSDTWMHIPTYVFVQICI
jgi:hypothetical protein